MSSKLIGCLLRSNPDMELVVYDRLEPGLRESIAPFRDDPDFYGLLMPRPGTGLSSVAVCQRTALLFLTLGREMKVPEIFLSAGPREASRQLTRLVLDGALEAHIDGRWLSGAEANRALGGVDTEGSNGKGSNGMGTNGAAIPKLSIEALQWVDLMELTDPQEITARLYCHNRRPVSARWQRQLGHARAVEGFLGIGPGQECRRRLDQHWRPAHFRRDGEVHWLSWRHRGLSPPRPGESQRHRGAGYKLYISPNLESLPEVLAVALRVMSDLAVPQFKVGADVFGLHRPDKVIAYPSSEEQLQALRRELESALPDGPAQPVPFSGVIDAPGRLSWGVDPQNCWLPSWQPGESWRLWLAQQLAVAIGAARRDPDPQAEAWRFALNRMNLEGIDTETWSPRAEALPHLTMEN